MKRGLRAIAFAAATTLAFAATPVFAANPPSYAADPPTYLALGDSVPFGYSPFVAPSDPDGFVGYPEDAALLVDQGVRNAACPGETSGSLISTSTADNGCQAFRSVGDLHVNYQGSQLDYALAFLHAHRHTSLVTMTIGANDFFLLEKSCTPPGESNPNITCVLAGFPAVLAQLQTNLVSIYTAIRSTGYQGLIVALTYYTVNYKDPIGVLVISKLDLVLAGVTQAFGGRVADGFDAFGAIALAGTNGGDSCAAGLLIPMGDGTCNIHPSAFGAEVLAEAVQAAVS